MKGELNNGLQPPDEFINWELERQAFEEKAFNWVKYRFNPEDIFDLYNHDREVAIRFHKWMMDYNSIHLVDNLADKPQPSMEEMFERFCTNHKQ